MAKTVIRRRRAPRRKAPMRKRMLRKRNNAKDMASLSVVRTFAPINTNAAVVYDNIQLADFQRAVQVAQAYQRFRMVGVKLTFKPAYDTYSQGGPLQKPNLYYIIDKSGSIPDNFTLEGLKQAGARPVPLDERPIFVRWSPSVLNETLNAAGAGSASGYKVSPLLATNGNATNPGPWIPSTVAHLGLKYYVEQQGGVSAVNVEAEVQFEFFKPIWPSLAAAPAVKMTYAAIDASPDGVEGGSDGITVPLGL